MECRARNWAWFPGPDVNQDRVDRSTLPTASGWVLVFEHIAGVEPLGGMYLDLRGRDGQRRGGRGCCSVAVRCGCRAPERPGHGGGHERADRLLVHPGLGAGSARGGRGVGVGAVHGPADRDAGGGAGRGDGLRDAVPDRGVSQGPQDRHEGRGIAVGDGRTVCSRRSP